MDKIDSNWLKITVIGAVIFIVLWAFLMPRLEKALAPKD